MVSPNYRPGDHDRDPELQGMEREQDSRGYGGPAYGSRDADFSRRAPTQEPGTSYGGSYGQLGGTREYAGGFAGRGPKGYRRSDARIREDVCDLLTDDPRVDAANIEVRVENCEVTLTGTVHAREDKRRAEDLAERVSGVKDVQNRLRVAEGEAKGERAASPSARH